MLIALEGIDGSGKSTLAELLREWLAGMGVSCRVLRNSSMRIDSPHIEARAEQLRRLLWPPHNEEGSLDVMGTKFYLFLHAAWATLVQKHAITPLAECGTSAILDGSYYRVIAKAHVRSDLDKVWLSSLFSEAPVPDLTIFLDIDPKLAWGRRAQFKPSEMGRWDGFDMAEPFDAYVGYQSRIRQQLCSFARRENWLVVEQTGEAPATILERVVSDERWHHLLSTQRPR